MGSSGRVFPKAFKASPLLRAWLARLEALGVRFALRHRWQGWDDDGALAFTDAAGEPVADRSPTPRSWRSAARAGRGSARTGPGSTCWPGAASPSRPCGRPIWASPIAWSDVMRSRFEGEPLKRIALTFEGRTVRGEAIVTADGIEGGAVYALSARLARRHRARRRAALLHIDLRPDLARRCSGEAPERTAKRPIRLDLPAQERRPEPGRNRPAAGGVPCPAGRARCARPPHQGRAPEADRHEIPGAGHFQRRRRAVRGARRAPDAAAAARASSSPARCWTGRRPPAATCCRPASPPASPPRKAS